ncbi:hypothetical protein [Providencia stuartii]|uniref:hypothetical protein n=1 Tax=Providencia stuartii TaxID=588 RepID=UPI00288891CA|nr:hypothetical protein [Providencia stuartii]MDT1068331.1 hypothetical protein [Providencia stuartii]
MKKLLIICATVVLLAGCGEKGTTYTCEINTELNELALNSKDAQSFPKGTTTAKIILNDNVMSIPALGKNGYKSHILKEMKEDNETKFLQKGDLIYDTPEVTEGFLVNKKIALVMVAGKWMQEFSNCKK